jgi:hypothetical protein
MKYRNCAPSSAVPITESAAEWQAEGPSIRAAFSAAAGGWERTAPHADSVQPMNIMCPLTHIE